jgi:nuclear GTP-binding protein
MGKQTPKSKDASSGPSLTNITKTKGVNFYRDASKVKELNMRKGGKPIRNSKGDIIQSAPFQSRLPSGTVARVQPNRRWFENTRVVGQKQLDAFREAINSKMNDPYAFVLRTKQLPLGLVSDIQKVFILILGL